MKRALFCVWMVLVLGWCTAWAETDWPPMTAEVMDDERFSIVEEGETRFLRYERKQGDTWATIWENDAILPDGELGWIYIDSSPGGGEWVTKWFIRKVGPQVSVCASWRREAEYEDFVVGLEKQQSGTWDVEFYENRQMELCMWLFEDKVLFCFPSDIAKGVCEEAPNRDAATFDPEVMRTMEARIVPYIEPEEIGGPSEEVGP